MSEDIKNKEEISEAVKDKKTFAININTNDKEFTLSGPEGSTFNEIEGVAYKILTEMVVLKWKETIRLKALSEEEKKK